jgi:hypothetical protein
VPNVKKIIPILLSFSALAGGRTMTSSDTMNASDFRLCNVYYVAPLNVNYHSSVLREELNRRFGANAFRYCQALVTEDRATAMGLFVVGAAAMVLRPAFTYYVSQQAAAPMPSAAPSAPTPPPVKTSVDCNSNLPGNAFYTH